MSILGPYSTNWVITEFPIHTQAKKQKIVKQNKTLSPPQHHEAHRATELDIVWSLLVSSYWRPGGNWGHSAGTWR